MQISTTLRLATWLVIALNLMMGIGAIAVFTRMKPAIARIIERNEASLDASREMLAALASPTPDHDRFETALARAKGNVTEEGEVAALEAIEASGPDALGGDSEATGQTIVAIGELAAINQQAMRTADIEAQRLGSAGAWGIVFMTSCIFAASMVFLRTMNRRVVLPLEEIDATLSDYIQGNRRRRCSAPWATREVKRLLDKVNRVLDDAA